VLGVLHARPAREAGHEPLLRLQLLRRQAHLKRCHTKVGDECAERRLEHIGRKRRRRWHVARRTEHLGRRVEHLELQLDQ